MDTEEENEFSLRREFNLCESFIKDLENGKYSSKDIQVQLKNCEEKLEILTREASARSLFTDNDSIDEIPTSSLDYLFLPYYLGTVVQNIIVEPEERISSLNRAKVYLRNFLERLKLFSIIDFELPWTNNDGEEKTIGKYKQLNLSEERQAKLQRLQEEMKLRELVKELELKLDSNIDDEYLMRSVVENRLRLAAIKSMKDLEQIEEEKPLAEHMLKIRRGEVEDMRKEPLRQSAKLPFIITRDQMQKKVLGLGYPSIPTMTVDEWYDDMVKNNRFGNINPSSSENSADLDIANEEEEEKERSRLRKWDEYKDYHRRGWGNMHNKG
ncbi:unnamed protein product [Thelazia callipaeda]|uniref:Immunoglobulin-binding protein 1 n=1 Tax=Thelazia callipaeda TaxID=103827 RepID=A0A0N5D2X7_THECL|nr:unnamed protein product [Thelazia callipaeda]